MSEILEDYLLYLWSCNLNIRTKQSSPRTPQLTFRKIHQSLTNLLIFFCLSSNCTGQSSLNTVGSIYFSKVLPFSSGTELILSKACTSQKSIKPECVELTTESSGYIEHWLHFHYRAFPFTVKHNVSFFFILRICDVTGTSGLA